MVMLMLLAFSVSAADIEGLKDPGAIPGDLTYGLKTAWERFQLTFTFNKEKQIAKQLEFAERRLAESAALREKGEVEKSVELMGKYQDKIEKVDGLIQKYGENIQTRTRIQERLYNHSRVMDKYELTNSTQQKVRLSYLHNHINQNAKGNGK